MHNNYQSKALSDIFQNAHLAMLSIDAVLPKVNDEGLRNEIRHQKKGYESIVKDVKSYAKKINVKLKDTGCIKKFFMRIAINCNLLFNKSKNHIATIMIKGTVMGVIELYAMKNEKGNLSEDLYSILEKLLNLEEDYEKNLKLYL